MVDMYVDKVADMVVDMVIDPITRKQIKMPRNSWKQWMSIVVVELWISTTKYSFIDKVKILDRNIVKEVKRSDGSQRFTCGDVFLVNNLFHPCH